MYNYVQVKTNQIYPFINGYYETLLAPMDDMWEDSILPKSTYYRIDEEETIGFFAIDDENIMTQFYITDLKHEDVFIDILKYFHIKKAYVSTYDPIFKAVSDKFKLAAVSHTLLFKQVHEPIKENTFSIESHVAMIHELEEVINYYERNDLGGAWLPAYIQTLIDNETLILFKKDNQIIASGEYRVSQSNRVFANIGMSVDSNHRSRGIGSYVLAYMRDHCNLKGYETICSTSADNKASKKCIEACGFVNYHTIYDVWF